jgi:predicted nuclease of predicted toxin-antitoxin system
LKLYFDENFPKAAHAVAESLGIEFFDHRGTRVEGIDDFGLFEIAQSKGAIVVTTDRDFYHTVPLLRPVHHGILVIALKQPNRRNIVERLRWALATFTADDFLNRAFSLRDGTWTARPPLNQSP